MIKYLNSFNFLFLILTNLDGYRKYDNMMAINMTSTMKIWIHESNLKFYTGAGFW